MAVHNLLEGISLMVRPVHFVHSVLNFQTLLLVTEILFRMIVTVFGFLIF